MPNTQAKLGPLLGALLLLWGTPGCSSVPLTSHNLDALLDGNGNLRHVAAVQSPWRYYLGALVDTQWLGESSLLSSKRKTNVGDPSYEALKYLLELQEPPSGTSRPHYQQLEQVRQFARFAVLCPGRLTRERALLALAPHGQRLELSAPLAPPAEAANGPELRSALAGLVQAATPLLRSAGRQDATLRSDLAAAAELFAELHLDVEGGWRALRALAVLAAGVGLEREGLEPLKLLSIDLQRRMVGMALHSGLRDNDSYVRAAAVRAAYQLFGEPFLAALLASIGSPPDSDRKLGFGLNGVFLKQPEVLVAAFELVREHGLPRSPELSPMLQRIERFEQLELLIEVVHRSQSLDDRTRTPAMLAMAEVLPAVEAGLRKEDWLAWWSSWAPAEVEALDQSVRAAAPNEG